MIIKRSESTSSLVSEKAKIAPCTEYSTKCSCGSGDARKKYNIFSTED